MRPAHIESCKHRNSFHLLGSCVFFEITQWFQLFTVLPYAPPAALLISMARL